MSQINLKSILGITSITTPAGVDDVFTVHSNDTTERFRVDQNGNQVIAGILTVTQNLNLLDNKYLQIGNSQDLQLYHNGSHSYIKDNGTGRLIIQSSQLCLQDTSGYNHIINNPGADVQLYYDFNNHSTPKLKTTATGVTIDGTAVATGADINGDLDVDGHTNLDNVSIAGVTTTSSLNISSTTPIIDFIETDGNPDYRLFAEGGAFVIRDQTSIIERFRITSAGNIGINETSPDTKLHISHSNATEDVIKLEATPVSAGTGERSRMIFQVTQSNGQSAKLGHIASHALNGWGGELSFHTKPANSTPNNATSEVMRLHANGYITEPSNPKFWAKSTNAQTLNGNGTNYIKNFENEIYDIGSCYDGTNKFTAPITGYYHFGWSFMLQGGNTNGFSYLFGAPLISGNDIAQEVMAPRSGGANYMSLVGSHLLYLTTGQYVQIRMRQSGGSAVSVRADQAYFWGYLVG